MKKIIGNFLKSVAYKSKRHTQKVPQRMEYQMNDWTKNDIKSRMKRMYNLLESVKANQTKHDSTLPLMTCLSDLEHVYDEIFADREKLADTIDKPMS